MKKKNSQTKVTVYFDNRRPKKDGTCFIKFRLYHQSKEKFINTGYSCIINHFIYGDSANNEFTSSLKKGDIKFVTSKASSSKRTNWNLDQKLQVANNFIRDNESTLNKYSPDELKKMVQFKVDHYKDQSADITTIDKISSSLIEGFQKKIKELKVAKSWGNHNAYKDTLSQLGKYLIYIGVDDIEIAEIDLSWLISFKNWCYSLRKKNGEPLKENSHYTRFKHIKHIIRRTCGDKNEKMTWADYPFDGFTLPKNKTGKRALEMDSIDNKILERNFDMNKVANIMDLFRQLRLEKNSPRWNYRNYLLFMWDCRGMDLVDLAYLKRKDIQNGVLIYSRQKVKGESIITIDLNEEAIEILNLYSYKDLSPNQLLFPFIRDVYEEHGGATEYVYKRYSSRRKYFNKRIKKLAEIIGLDNATSKMIRHTWAYEGFQKFENIDTIGEGLGHQNNPHITKIYARDLNRNRINQVNEEITKRKSIISSFDWKLKLDLYQYFHRGKAWNVEIDEFKNRVFNKITSYEKEVAAILDNKSLNEWDAKLNQFQRNEFNSYDEVDLWLKKNLNQFCEIHNIWLITKDYV